MQKSELQVLADLSAFIKEKEAEMEAACTGGNIDSLRQAKYVSVALRAQRIHLCLALIEQGHGEHTRQIRADWETILDCLETLQGPRHNRAQSFTDAINIILLPNPGRKGALLKQLGVGVVFMMEQPPYLRHHVFRCGQYLANWCPREEIPTVISNLISLSEKYNQSHPKLHKEYVLTALHSVVDVDNELTCTIGREQQQHFAGFEDIPTARFLWYYGYASLVIGNTEESIPLLQRCHELFVQLEGDRSWTGACAGMLYACALLEKESSPPAEEYLWDTLRKMEQGYYSETDSYSELLCALARFRLLNIRFERQNLQGLLPDIQRFRDYCQKNDTVAKNGIFSVRYAENILSAYYLETCDYLQAADHAVKALNDRPADGSPAFPEDALIYSNLLMIYSVIHDENQMIHYYNLLLEEKDEYKDNDYITARINIALHQVENTLNIGDIPFDDAWETVNDFYARMTNGTVSEEGSNEKNITIAIWMLDRVGILLYLGECDMDSLQRLQDIILYFLDRPHIYPFSNTKQALCHFLLSLAKLRMDAPDTEDSLKKTLQYLPAVAPSSEARTTILCTIISIYYHRKKPDIYLSLIDEAMNCFTSAWQKATAFLNDQKVYQMFSQHQLNFSSCYSILRAEMDSKSIYECVLRFKDLPALVGRERNRLLRLAPVDAHLQSEIFALQDQLAAAEWNDSLLGTDTAQAIALQLQNREAAFAEQFPQNMSFTEISFDKLCRKLPDNSAILEYYFSLHQFGKNGPEYETPVNTDVFVTTKIHGQVQFHHLRLENGNSILDQAEEFIEILQDPDNISRTGRKNRLRGELYKTLIAPVIPYLAGVETLYIAPDDMLCNLPFEILYHNNSGTLQSRFAICRLVCGRDILFYDDLPSAGSGHFILGDPNYEAEKGQRSKSKSRGAESSLTPVDSLPFSGMEARRIARLCRTTPITGDRATKFALQEALPCKIIHIATHGIFDEETVMDSLYASHLVFAGYNKWVKEKTESSGCGNGILTADEISRMDLHKTDLVVLSACQTGLGDVSYRSTRGLISAFSAAGARWIICHMWEASDFATPILMDAFYRAHLHLRMEVPAALQYAKNYLRSVTIGDLRRDGWLDIPFDSNLSEDAKELIMALRKVNDHRKPFEDEFYWGGFTAHKSR